MAEARNNAGRILVINPNSNREVTAGLDEAVQPLRFAGGPAIECMTLAEGPFGIESQRDVESVTLPLRAVVAGRDDADAFVIACYSDPGLHVCREATQKPVLGIQECGVLAALGRGERFGVVAIAGASIPRHLRYLRQMGLDKRLAAERPLDMTVAESVGGAQTFARLEAVGRRLVADDGADVLILGCAGMACHRAPLEAALGVPVIDPTQAAVTVALGAVALNRR